MRHVDLCSGIGGFSLGFEWAGLSKPVLFCDVEPWCRQVLSKHWPDVPVACDVKELANDPDRNVPDCDILTAGYPCQPFSLAGKRGGEEDPRHIWPYILRIVASKRPSWCVFENVYGHLTLGLDQVLLDLEAEGYASRTFVVPACGVDAPHRRDRLWIVAHSNSDGKSDVTEHGEQRQGQLGKSDVADADSNDGRHISSAKSSERETRLEYRRGGDRQSIGETEQNMADTNSTRREEQRWPPEPAVGRVAHGIPRRVDRLRGLGNAIIPQIAMRIGMTIKSIADQ